MNFKNKRMMMLVFASLMLGTGIMISHPISATTISNVKEDKGIVVENNPALGYLKYQSVDGKIYTRNYDLINLRVEKLPFYEDEDMIGNIDKLFPMFTYNPKNASLEAVQTGDSIYVQLNSKGEVVYINSFNEYFSRHGKVKRWDGDLLILEDNKKREFVYEIDPLTPITKGGSPYSLGSLQEGEWVRVLVCEKLIGDGNATEEVLEIVADADIRKVDGIYKGNVLSVDKYKNVINVKNVSVLNKSGWDKRADVLPLSVKPEELSSFYMGMPTNLSYIERYLRNGLDTSYFATEVIMGKPQVVKMNTNTQRQMLLPETTVVYSTPTNIKLRSGEDLLIGQDAILVKNNKLIEPYNIKQGDKIRVVTAGTNTVAVAQIMDGKVNEQLEVFRGRIERVDEGNLFEVETFSTLVDGEWYYHPEPRTFTIDESTKVVNETGVVLEGIEAFLGYGEESVLNEVFNIVAIGDHALSITEMPYAKESITGEVYLADSGELKLKDVYYLDRKNGKWKEFSKQNKGISVEILPNTTIIKEGMLVSPKDLEKGDVVEIMIVEDILNSEGSVQGFVISAK